MGWTYSYSQFEKFETCPRSYYEQYVAGIPVVRTQQLELGDLAHRAINQVILGHVSEKELEDWTRAQIPQFVWLEDADALQVADWVRTFASVFRPEGEVATEKEYSIELGPDKRVKGRLDLIQRAKDRVIITDFKTNGEAYGPLDTMQMPLYAALAAETEGVEIVEARLWFLRYRQKPLRVETFNTSVMRNALAWASDLIDKIEAAKCLPGSAGFPEKPGSACKWCPAAVSCAGLSIDNLTGVLDAAEAARLAGEALRLEAALNVLKKRLQTHIAESGAASVEINGEHWGNYPKPQYVLSSQRLAEFCERIRRTGKDPGEFIEINPWVLMKRENEGLKSWIEAHAEKRTKTYFSHRDKAPEAA